MTKVVGGLDFSATGLALNQSLFFLLTLYFY